MKTVCHVERHDENRDENEEENLWWWAKEIDEWSEQKEGGKEFFTNYEIDY